MPFHRIFHSPGAFTEQEKAGLANAITDQYAKLGLARFWVVVIFVPLESSDFYLGGVKNEKKFVRITVDHLARQFINHARVKMFMDTYEATLAPFIKAKGYDWEVQVAEYDRNLWRYNGMEPPLPRTAAEKKWKEQNRPVPYAPEENTFAL